MRWRTETPEAKPKTETSGRVSEVLCEYSLGLKGRDIPRQVIVRTKEFFLDFLAVAFGGRQVADSSAILIRGVKSLMRGARGTCSVIGERDLYPPHYAAVLNGAFAHSMDFDDTHREAVMHTGTTVFPTLLAGWAGRAPGVCAGMTILLKPKELRR